MTHFHIKVVPILTTQIPLPSPILSVKYHTFTYRVLFVPLMMNIRYINEMTTCTKQYCNNTTNNLGQHILRLGCIRNSTTSTHQLLRILHSDWSDTDLLFHNTRSVNIKTDKNKVLYTSSVAE